MGKTGVKPSEELVKNMEAAQQLPVLLPVKNELFIDKYVEDKFVCSFR